MTLHFQCKNKDITQQLLIAAKTGVAQATNGAKKEICPMTDLQLNRSLNEELMTPTAMTRTLTRLTTRIATFAMGIKMYSFMAENKRTKGIFIKYFLHFVFTSLKGMIN
ncbi:MAG: hypothetical protein LKI94_02675 [Sporolactobacillus sp.]|jgi:hypothetical protein|nr:hypothetical protein [Sporolactobacillus sp.]MCI1881079.1 hypothetical protein [Sporolactobacillus sp.]